MRVLAISDLHLDFRANLEALERLEPHPLDWLIVAGDVGHGEEHLGRAMSTLVRLFNRVIWTPGNHELWTVPGTRSELRGEAKYRRLVEICRGYGVLTPEDPYPELTVDGVRYVLAPLFLLYDYSFGPPGLTPTEAVQWAAETDVMCTDEYYLSPEPHDSVVAWCHSRVAWTHARLKAVAPAHRLILINHFALRPDLVRIYIPRFRIWCGTRKTELWHREFNVAAVVSGHTHVRCSATIDGVRFEEVSLGYPRQWSSRLELGSYLRQILPDPGSQGPP